jgi:hypothetical protein
MAELIPPKTDDIRETVRTKYAAAARAAAADSSAACCGVPTTDAAGTQVFGGAL